jgi:hypothetical protein
MFEDSKKLYCQVDRGYLLDIVICLFTAIWLFYLNRFGGIYFRFAFGFVFSGNEGSVYLDSQ